MVGGMARSASVAAAASTQVQRVSNGNTGVAQRQGSRNQPPNPNRSSQRDPTQEQVIVGHFCRHAIKTLTKVMQNDPRAAETEAKLRDHIKSVWDKWTQRMITRAQLLGSVATFVRNSCEAASRIDVIREFKAWYEREYELQKQRTGVRAREQAKMQAEIARRGSAQNPLQAMRAQSSAVPGKAGIMSSAGMQTRAGNRAGLSAEQSAQLMASSTAVQAYSENRAGLKSAQSTASQEAQLTLSACEKRLASMTISRKHTAG